MIKNMYLFFDTETTGLPRNWKAPVTDLNNWPRMIQIAWILCDKDGNRIEFDDYIIKPVNFIVPSASVGVHGISTERALEEGEDLEEVLCKFNELVDRSDCIVAHNLSFDEKIVGAELLRNRIQSNFNRKRKLCTMHSSTNYCRLSGPYGYKWPTLSELHIRLFGKDFEEAHDASADINATEKCFLGTKEKGNYLVSIVLSALLLGFKWGTFIIELKAQFFSQVYNLISVAPSVTPACRVEFQTSAGNGF